MNVLKGVAGWLNKYRSVFALTFAGLVLLLAQSAFWINHTIFDQTTFTTITKDVLSSEESRQAIAKTVVDNALADRPIAKRVAGEKATQLVTGLLGTDLVSQTMSTVIDKSYAYLTSANRQVIDIDLLPIKTPLAGLVSFAESQGREVQFDPGTIPDTIVLYDPSDLPDFHATSTRMLWLGPVLWLLSLGIFAGYIYRGRRVYAKRVYIVGTVIIISSAIGLLAGPMVPPPVSASVQIVELRSVVNDLVAAFLAPFTSQMLTTIGITLVVLAIFSQRNNIVQLSQKALAAGQKKTAKEVVSSPTKKPRKKS